MKRMFSKRVWIAVIALLTVPAVLFAQETEKKEMKERPERKEKAEKDISTQSIIITRKGDKDQKTVIEINGDKVKINGKDADENKDVKVSIRNMRRNENKNMFLYTPGEDGKNMKDFEFKDFSFNDGDGRSFFHEDENRAMLGVSTDEGDKGAAIQMVSKESAAEKAGLKKGDVITRIGDKKIESADDVTEAVRAHKPGDKVDITYTRDGKEQKTTATLGKWKGLNMSAMAIPHIQGFQNFNQMSPMPAMPPMNNIPEMIYGNNRPRLGLSIQDVEEGNGVKVIDVDEEGSAAKAGIKKDDVITGINDHEVQGTEDLTKYIRENREKPSFTLRFKRDGKTQNVEVKYPKKLRTADL